MHLRDVPAEAILSLVEGIHAAPLSPDGWRTSLERLRVAMGIPYAAHMIRTDDHRNRRGVAAGATDAEYRHMLDTFFTGSVYFRTPYPIYAGQIAASRDMAPREQVLSSAIYQGWNRHHDVHEMLRLCLRAAHGVSEVVTLGRPWSAGPFADGDVALGHTLMPHLRAAAAVADRLAGADLLTAGALDALDRLHQAVLMLDPAGRVFHANRLADGLLTASGMLDVSGGTLRAPVPADNGRLAEVTARALGTGPDGMPRAGSLRLSRPDGAASLALLVVPFAPETEWAVLHRPAALVFITDPGRAPVLPSRQLQDLFNLTAAEARLAGALLAGHEPREIAERQNRSIATVRTHITRLMAKTGVNRQSRLTALLSSFPRGYDTPGSKPTYGITRPGNGGPTE